MSLQPWETSIEDGLQAAVLSGTLTIKGYLALTAADKDVNNGVCSLNALGLPQDKSGNDVSMASELISHAADTTAIHGITDTSKLGVTASGNYVGDGTTNRAIPHGLGVKPKSITLIGAITATPTDQYTYLIQIDGYITYIHGLLGTAVTTMTDTYFYVGDAANDIGNHVQFTYYWTAYG